MTCTHPTHNYEIDRYGVCGLCNQSKKQGTKIRDDTKKV